MTCGAGLEATRGTSEGKKTRKKQMLKYKTWMNNTKKCGNQKKQYSRQ